MSSSNDRSGDNASYALTLFEKKTLAETRRYTNTCGNKIAEDKEYFARKGALGLWWDAKGLFNSSNKEEVTAYMEEYRAFFKKIDEFTEGVERGDPESYNNLLRILKELDEREKNAQKDVKSNKSSAVCAMLREFLDKKYNLDHNLKKVECIVLQQKMHQIEQTCRDSKETMQELSEKMDKISTRYDSEMDTLKKEKAELASEADRRCEAIRREKDELLRQALNEAEERSDARIRTMKEENDKLRLDSDQKLEQALKEAEERSEARIRAMKEESDARLEQVLKEAEERSEARIRAMKEESDRLRLEAENTRRASEESMKEAVEEANRRAQASMQEMAEQNRASLQKMTRILESLSPP